jgi:hypothetical protein
MAIDYIKPQETLSARAFEIIINKLIPDSPELVFNYTNDRESLGSVAITPQQVIEQGIVTLEEVQQAEATLKKIADSISPVKEIE